MGSQVGTTSDSGEESHFTMLAGQLKKIGYVQIGMTLIVFSTLCVNNEAWKSLSVSANFLESSDIYCPDFDKVVLFARKFAFNSIAFVQLYAGFNWLFFAIALM